MAVLPLTAARAVAGSKRGWVFVPLALFLATRVVDTALVAILGHDQGPRVDQAGMFVTEETGASPGYWQLLTNWDGQWYQQIAEHGYPRHLPVDDGAVRQNPWAFAPLYPALVRLLMIATSLPFAVAASLLSMSAAAGAMVLIYRLLSRGSGEFNAAMTVLSLGLGPAGVVFQLAYAEGLALLLVASVLYLLVERRYAWLCPVLLLLALTRPVSVVFALVIAVHVVARWRDRGQTRFSLAERWWCAAAAVTAVAGAGVWPLVCTLVVGDTTAYTSTSQAFFSGTTPWLSLMVRHPLSSVTLLGVLLAAAALAMVVRPGARAWPLEVRAWVPAYGLFFALASPPTTGVLRYAVLTIVPFWPVAEPDEFNVARRRAVAVVAVVVIGVFMQVMWLRYCWILGPARGAIP
jgi:hypothetical protein